MGGVNAAKENQAMVNKQIRILENRLDKVREQAWLCQLRSLFTHCLGRTRSRSEHFSRDSGICENCCCCGVPLRTGRICCRCGRCLSFLSSKVQRVTSCLCHVMRPLPRRL